ncbi:MAG: hypothetical protein L3J03_08030 [Desulfobacterales bacterium]|nr:hypothetical protein [Desulfobacterales bacterium]
MNVIIAARRFARTPGAAGSGSMVRKKLAQAMGGDIRVQSRQGIGTRFQGRFPVQERE